MSSTVEKRVRAAVARLAWSTNPASLALAEVAVDAARAVDTGAGRLARQVLRMTLLALRECGREADGIDSLRAQYARRRLDYATRTEPDEEGQR